MKVYRKCPRTGFIIELHTVGSYKPVGWATSRDAAKKRNPYKPKKRKDGTYR